MSSGGQELAVSRLFASLLLVPSGSAKDCNRLMLLAGGASGSTLAGDEAIVVGSRRLSAVVVGLGWHCGSELWRANS